MTIAATPPASPGFTGRDTLFAAAVLGVLAILFLPVPPPLIDAGLAASIALSVMILMVALWIDRPLDFSSFPTVLLIATMLRLSLNVATTRTILSEGHEGVNAAGHVIGGFSAFVMAGDFMIGIVVFLILVTVNFVVITKGAGRIAEVSARFTLDGIPGKQMAIDADVAAGTIDEKEAQRRRRELEEESAFFGSMDGASKFVRGDAIAGLLITAVNMLGGIVIGIARHGMGAAEAADVFVKLSVGDGLVSQIPALIVSLAAGLVVSKGGTRGSADRAVLDQVSAHPRALRLAALLMGVLALAPGLPFLPFALFGLALAATGTIVTRRRTATALADAQALEDGDAAERPADTVEAALDVPAVELVSGSAAAALFALERAEMAHRMDRLRRRLALRYGFVVPEVRLSTDLSLPPRAYRIRVHGARVAAGEVWPGEVLVVPGGRDVPGDGAPTVEPAFGLSALRMGADRSETLRASGFRPIDPISATLTHLAETIRGNLGRLLSHRDLRALVGRLDTDTRRLAEGLGDGPLGWAGLQAILRHLLGEGVSIRSLDRIVEAIAEVPPEMRREAIAEHVRSALAPQLCDDLAGEGPLRIVRLGDWEAKLLAAIRRDGRGEVVAFDIAPELLARFGEAVRARLPRLGPEPRPALVTTPELRPFVRMILERIDPDLAVLAHAEIPYSQPIELVGELGAAD